MLHSAGTCFGNHCLFVAPLIVYLPNESVPTSCSCKEDIYLQMPTSLPSGEPCSRLIITAGQLAFSGEIQQYQPRHFSLYWFSLKCIYKPFYFWVEWELMKTLQLYFCRQRDFPSLPEPETQQEVRGDFSRAGGNPF